jgi:hypothetical protein
MRRFRYLVLLLAAGLAVTVSGSGPTPSEDLEANLKLLREWQSTDPAQYDKIARSFEQFRRMTPQQQDRLRTLDQQLHDEDPATRIRLMHALEEYAAWLTNLPNEQRQRILSAINSGERLKIIRELKEKQWFEQLPLAYREQYRKAPADDRKKLLEQWKKEEQKRREDRSEQRGWEAVAHERPFKAMADENFRKDLFTFVSKRLEPMLSDDEQNRLKKFLDEPRRGPMPWLPWMRAVADLSDRHPVLSLDPRYRSKKDLPPEYQKALDNPPDSAAKRAVANLPEGKWPQFAIEATKLLRSWNMPMPQQLGPASAKEISPAVVDFVQGPLAGALTEHEKERLKQAEGKWPDYPKALHELAKAHKLRIPDLDLPGEPSLWNSVRNFQARRLPDPPPDKLRKFAMEFNKQHNGVPLSPDDSFGREVLKRRYYEKYPEALIQAEKQERTRGGW